MLKILKLFVVLTFFVFLSFGSNLVQSQSQETGKEKVPSVFEEEGRSVKLEDDGEISAENNITSLILAEDILAQNENPTIIEPPTLKCYTCSVHDSECKKPNDRLVDDCPKIEVSDGNSSEISLCYTITEYFEIRSSLVSRGCVNFKKGDLPSTANCTISSTTETCYCSTDECNGNEKFEWSKVIKKIEIYEKGKSKKILAGRKSKSFAENSMKSSNVLIILELLATLCFSYSKYLYVSI